MTGTTAKTTTLSLAATLAMFSAAFPAMADGEVNIYSYRQPELIKPLLDAFTKETGIATNVLFLDKGLVERIQAEGENSPADVILTVDIARLTEAKDGGVTQPVSDEVINKDIPANFRDPAGDWFGLELSFAGKLQAAHTEEAQEARQARRSGLHADIRAQEGGTHAEHPP